MSPCHRCLYNSDRWANSAVPKVSKRDPRCGLQFVPLGTFQLIGRTPAFVAQVRACGPVGIAGFDCLKPDQITECPAFRPQEFPARETMMAEAGIEPWVVALRDGPNVTQQWVREQKHNWEREYAKLEAE